MTAYNVCLQDHGVETFLIKREEPLYTRRRGPRFSRSRLWSEDERSNNTISQVLAVRLFALSSHVVCMCVCVCVIHCRGRLLVTQPAFTLRSELRAHRPIWVGQKLHHQGPSRHLDLAHHTLHTSRDSEATIPRVTSRTY